MEVKKILCAVDLEDTIAPSVEYAKMMASMTGASILVAYVIPAHTPYEDVLLADIQSIQAQSILYIHQKEKRKK